MVIMERTKVSLSVVGVLLVCATSLASVDGGWSDWSRWRSCSQTCGAGGSRARNRTCSNPRRQHGGLQCEGSSMERMPCSPLGPCPVDGGWSDWTEWGACTAIVCRKRGNRFRTRSCNNPEPLHGGSYCKGTSSEGEKCKKADCPVHGGWSAWRDSTPCFTTCGIGIRNQIRTCDNPAPANSTTRSGKDCIGESSKMILCRVPTSCPIDDGSESSFDTGYIPTTSTTPEVVAPEEDSERSSVSSVADPVPVPEGPGDGSWVSDDYDGSNWASDGWEEPTTPENEPSLSSVDESPVDPPANPGNEQSSSFADPQVDGPTTPGNHGNGGEECDPASDPDASSFCP